MAGTGKGSQGKAEDDSVLFCDGENRVAEGDGEEKTLISQQKKKKKKSRDKCLSWLEVASQTRHDLMLYPVLNLRVCVCSEKAPTHETLAFKVCECIRLSRVSNNAAQVSVTHAAVHEQTHTHTHTSLQAQ